jgi:hypothetical protein
MIRPTVGFIVYGVHKDGLKDPMGSPFIDEAIVGPPQDQLQSRLEECRIPFWPHAFVTPHCDIETLLQNWTSEYACLGYGAELYPALVDFCELTGTSAVLP